MKTTPTGIPVEWIEKHPGLTMGLQVIALIVAATAFYYVERPELWAETKAKIKALFRKRK